MMASAVRDQLPVMRLRLIAGDAAAVDFGDDPTHGVIIQSDDPFTFVPLGQTDEVEASLAQGVIHAIRVKSIPAANEATVLACWSRAR